VNVLELPIRLDLHGYTILNHYVQQIRSGYALVTVHGYFVNGRHTSKIGIRSQKLESRKESEIIVPVLVFFSF
jgi:hypothetical protein